jgi:hypothetical protein
MEYGKLSGNSSINETIYKCFEYICKKDIKKFVKVFRRAKLHTETGNQALHTYRELILGAYLSANGLTVRHDYNVDNKTPDWCILDNASAVIGIIELTNFHIDKTTEREIEEQIKANGIALYHADNFKRLYHCIRYKAGIYQDLVKKLLIPYVVAVFGSFEPAVDFKEVQSCIFDKDIALFKMYPEVSGIIYFRESLGRYLFDYARNPSALHRIELPSVGFP